MQLMMWNGINCSQSWMLNEVDFSPCIHLPHDSLGWYHKRWLKPYAKAALSCNEVTWLRRSEEVLSERIPDFMGTSQKWTFLINLMKPASLLLPRRLQGKKKRFNNHVDFLKRKKKKKEKNIHWAGALPEVNHMHLHLRSLTTIHWRQASKH